MAGRRLAVLGALVFAEAGCSGSGGPAVPPLSDAPVLAAAAAKDLSEYVPGYGITVRTGGSIQFEVSIEAEDSSRVQPGQSATAYILPERRAISCRVARVLRGASEETGQSLAWLELSGAAEVSPNEFLYANILVRVKRRVLTVPRPAVLVRDGRLFAVRASSRTYQAVEISTGVASGQDVEIVSGLAAGDSVVVQGGVGILYPDFKSQGGGD